MFSAADFFARRADAFREGRFSDVSQTYLYPTPIFTGDQVAVMHSSADLVETLAECRETLRRAGYAYSHPFILSTDHTAPDRARITLRWTNFSRDETVIDRADMVYFLTHMPDTGWRIAMIERLTMENMRPVFA